ncbi:MAG: glutaredoxin 3 [Alphaproteobacteria bacterium]
MKNVTIYSTSYCPYCVRAKQLFTQLGHPFEEIDVTEDQAKRAWLEQTTGRRTVPQIFIGEEHVGGCDDVYALHKAGQLVSKLGR